MIVARINLMNRIKGLYGPLVNESLENTVSICMIGWFCADYTVQWVEHWEEKK